jgi:serine/threonine protein kinase
LTLVLLFAGTPAYMAPELVMQCYDEEADLLLLTLQLLKLLLLLLLLLDCVCCLQARLPTWRPSW